MSLIPDSQWPALCQRAQSAAFEAAMLRLRREVAEYVQQPIATPTEPAGYYHDYFCPAHGVQLIFDPAEPLAHRCPVDGATLRGVQYDAARRWFVNNRLSEVALRLALLWRLEGDPRHLKRAAAIL